MVMQSGDVGLGHVVVAGVSRAPSASLAAQWILDCLVCVLAAPFALTIGAVIAFLVRLDGFPALYSQQRIGLDGRGFHCLKFRSMIPGADECLERVLACDPDARGQWESFQKLAKDPRITQLGKFIRAFSLDELPQLINVWRGEMSIVGPRPILAEQIARYGDSFPAYCSLRPGITGLWQVGGRNNCTFAERVRLDMHYARTRSVLTDMRIIFLTIPAVFARKGAR